MARPWASGGGAARRQACLGCEGGRLGPGGAKSPEHLGFQVQTGLHWRHSPSKMDPSSAHEPRGLHGPVPSDTARTRRASQSRLSSCPGPDGQGAFSPLFQLTAPRVSNPG